MCTNLGLCRVPVQYRSQLGIHNLEEYGPTHEVGRGFGLRPSIKDAISLRWKGSDNAVVSFSVSTVLGFRDERPIVADFADQYHFCHHIVRLLVSKKYWRLREMRSSGEVVDNTIVGPLRQEPSS